MSAPRAEDESHTTRPLPQMMPEQYEAMAQRHQAMSQQPGMGTEPSPPAESHQHDL